MNYTELISQILLIVSVLTALVNIVTEVAKERLVGCRGLKRSMLLCWSCP